MGSFQQISIGVVCLAAAFAFGNYVNNHPPTSEHPFEQTASNSVDGDATSVGNVKSRLTNNQLDVVDKRPAPIATMRHALKPRFSMPVTDRSIAAAPRQNRLPPPSQLDVAPTAQSRNAPPIQTQLGLTDSQKPSPSVGTMDVPDFSEIAVDFRNSPIERPSLGVMPSHRNPIDSSIAVPNPMARPKTDPLKDLARQFASQPSVEQPIANSPVTMAPWDSKRPDFTDADFSPKLKQRLGGPSRNPLNEAPLKTGESVMTKTPLISPSVPLPENVAMDNSNQNAQGFSYAPPVDPDSMSANQAPLKSIPRARTAVSPQSTPPETRQSTLYNGAWENPARSLETNRIASKHMIPSESEHGFSNPTIDSNKSNRVRTMLPFGLTDQAKNKLVAIQSNANSRISVDATKFADHVIQQNETLQSISIRYYGKPDFYLDIYLANRNKLRNPADTQPGTAIRIPIYE